MPSVKLTDAFVRGATAIGGRTTEYRDQKTPALALRVSAGRSKSWTMRYRTNDGVQRRYTIGPYPAITLSLARERALAILAEASGGGDPARDKKTAKELKRVPPAFTLLAISQNAISPTLEKTGTDQRESPNAPARSAARSTTMIALSRRYSVAHRSLACPRRHPGLRQPDRRRARPLIRQTVPDGSPPALCLRRVARNRPYQSLYLRRGAGFRRP